MGHKDLRLGQIVYILVFYNISFSWLLPLDGFQFIFLLRYSENDLYYICIYNVEVGGHIQQDIFLIWTDMFFMLVVTHEEFDSRLFVAKRSIKTRQ